MTLLGSCQSQKLTNIDYLGTGYDIITGNPHNHLYDPGKINLLNLANFLKFWKNTFFYLEKMFMCKKNEMKNLPKISNL